jgi:hypothetical protein
LDHQNAPAPIDVNSDAGAPATPPMPADPAAGDQNQAGAATDVDFGQLGLTMNDATRALVGGLWQTATEEGGQGLGNAGHYTDDLAAVQQGFSTALAAGQFTGDTQTHVQAILTDLTNASAAATASVNGGGSFGSVAAAETALHDSHLDVLNIINSDPVLHGLATQNDAQGFLAAPPALADGVTPQNAPHDTLAQVGAIFDDFVNHSLGGINASNQQYLSQEANVLVSYMQHLIAANPDQFQGLTAVHAEAIVNQLQLEPKYIHDAVAGDPAAGRGSNDNLLDMIDIVQGDDNLAQMANNGGVSGFTALGDALNPTPQYMDNQAQTNFWAGFIADSNSLGQRAIEAVQSGAPNAQAGLIGDLMQFQNQATHFDASQGGIFGARFDNELLGNTSTLGAEVSKMIEGLKTGNAELVAAAADQMHNNAADVGGNNLPVNGGTYNTDGLTVADVLGAAPQVAANTPAPAAPTAGQSGGAHHAAPAPQPVVAAVHDDPAAHVQHDPHGFAHMWA